MNNVQIVHNEMKYMFDGTLSLKAKGLMALMVAYVNKNAQKTTFRVQDIEDLYVDGASSYKTALNELIYKGYVSRMIAKDTGKKGIIWVFTLYE